ncbi:MAG: glycoside hydrolase family protein [Lentisphaeria bacterium]|nr:glycoside hydrolase family protein [Lentisphaeria bacterium]
MSTTPDLLAMRQPSIAGSEFKQDDYFTWGGSITRSDDGQYHMYVSRWPRSAEFKGWVTHSEVVHAVAETAAGPYTYRDLALGRCEKGRWDCDVAHNPTVIRWQGIYYLYYTGNFGNGEYWDHRNNQRVGVAVSESPDGPWERRDQPLLEVSAGCWDSLITTNPSCTPTPDGRFLLMYKAAGHERDLPMGGPVLHGVAFADSPLGPFAKHPDPIFVAKDAWFPGEDPFVWTQDGRLYAILKDQGSHYSPEDRALVLFESDNGIDWAIAEQPVVCPRTVQWDDGRTVEYNRLERPQLYLENGVPTVLSVAVKPDKSEPDSYNIRVPLG